MSVYQFDLPYPEKKRVLRNGYIAVLLDVPPGIRYNCNVFCYSDRYEYLWQVDNKIVENYTYTNEDSPFVDIDFDAAGRLVLYNSGGWKIRVDSSTGNTYDGIGAAYTLDNVRIDRLDITTGRLVQPCQLGADGKGLR